MEDELSIKAEKNCSNSLGVTPFSIENILYSNNKSAEDLDFQERALDMSKSGRKLPGELFSIFPSLQPENGSVSKLNPFV